MRGLSAPTAPTYWNTVSSNSRGQGILRHNGPSTQQQLGKWGRLSAGIWIGGEGKDYVRFIGLLDHAITITCPKLSYDHLICNLHTDTVTFVQSSRALILQIQSREYRIGRKVLL